MKALPMIRYALLAALMFAAAPAQAAERITQDLIYDYYERASAAFKLPFEEYRQAQEEMLAPNYVSNAQITFIMPGTRPTQRTEKLTKGQALRIAEQTYAAMKNADITYSVKDIKIAPSGRSAQVRDTITVTGIGMQGLPVTMNTSGGCSETLALNAAGILQVTSSNCALKSVVMPNLR